MRYPSPPPTWTYHPWSVNVKKSMRWRSHHPLLSFVIRSLLFVIFPIFHRCPTSLVIRILLLVDYEVEKISRCFHPMILFINFCSALWLAVIFSASRGIKIQINFSAQLCTPPHSCSAPIAMSACLLDCCCPVSCIFLACCCYIYSYVVIS